MKLNPPNMIAVEVTKLCDMKCVMCVSHSAELYAGQADKQPAFMDIDLFKKIVDQYVAMQPDEKFRSITPQFQGESLLNPNFLKYCQILEDARVSFSFTTNGSRLTEELCAKLLSFNYFRNLCFSIDGVTKSTYEQIRIKGKYDNVHSNIRGFLGMLAEANLTREYPVQTSVSYTEQPLNENETDDFIRYWSGKVDSVSINNVAINGRPVNVSWRPERVPCGDLWNFMIILTDGKVVPCCRDYLYELDVGSVAEDSLEAVWGGEKYNKLRELHLNKLWDEIPICRDCDTWMCRDERREVSVAGGLQVTQGPFFRSARLGASEFDTVVLLATEESLSKKELAMLTFDFGKPGVPIYLFVGEKFADLPAEYNIHPGCSVVATPQANQATYIAQTLRDAGSIAPLIISLDFSCTEYFRSAFAWRKVVYVSDLVVDEMMKEETLKAYEKRASALSADYVCAEHQQAADKLSNLLPEIGTVIPLQDHQSLLVRQKSRSSHPVISINLQEN